MARRSPVPWLLLCLVAACSRQPAPAPSRTSDAVRGIALGLFASDPEYDYGPLLGEIVAHGATDVLLAVPWYQSTASTHDLAALPGRSPSETTIARTLAQARKTELRIGLM